MIDAIVYTSNTGLTKQYANLLENKLEFLTHDASYVSEGNLAAVMAWYNTEISKK